MGNSPVADAGRLPASFSVRPCGLLHIQGNEVAESIPSPSTEKISAGSDFFGRGRRRGEERGGRGEEFQPEVRSSVRGRREPATEGGDAKAPGHPGALFCAVSGRERKRRERKTKIDPDRSEF